MIKMLTYLNGELKQDEIEWESKLVLVFSLRLQNLDRDSAPYKLENVFNFANQSMEWHSLISKTDLFWLLDGAGDIKRSISAVSKPVYMRVYMSFSSPVRFSECPLKKVAVINRNGRGWLF